MRKVKTAYLEFVTNGSYHNVGTCYDECTEEWLWAHTTGRGPTEIRIQRYLRIQPDATCGLGLPEAVTRR